MRVGREEGLPLQPSSGWERKVLCRWLVDGRDLSNRELLMLPLSFCGMYRKLCFLNRTHWSRSFSTMAVFVWGHFCRGVCGVRLHWVSWVSRVLSFLEPRASLASEHHVLLIVPISLSSLWLIDVTGSFLLILSSDCQSASPLAQRGCLLRNRLSSLL